MAKSRAEYLEHVKQQRPHALEGYVTMVDDYNTQFFMPPDFPAPGNDYNAHEISNFLLNNKDLFRTEIYEKDFPKSGSVTAAEYATKIMKHPTLSPARTVGGAPLAKEGFTDKTMSKPEYGGKAGKTWADVGFKVDALNRSFRAIRRACKFGIGFVADKVATSRPQAKIHFALDRIRMDSAFDKNLKIPQALGNEGVPITYSELRYTCRNWHRFKPRVTFYINYQEVPAPWEKDWELDDCFGMRQKALHGQWLKYMETVKLKHAGDKKYDPDEEAKVLASMNT